MSTTSVLNLAEIERRLVGPDYGWGSFGPGRARCRDRLRDPFPPANGRTQLSIAEHVAGTPIRRLNSDPSLRVFRPYPEILAFYDGRIEELPFDASNDGRRATEPLSLVK